MRRRGFTILEILIVIGIVAVLASIIFTTSYAAFRKKRQADCQLQLKRLHDAITLYHDDTSIYPEKVWAADPADGVNPMRTLVDSGKIEKVMLCPEDPMNSNADVADRELGTYGVLYNYWGYGLSAEPTPLTAKSDAKTAYEIVENPLTAQQDFWRTSELDDEPGGEGQPNTSFPGLANPTAPPNTIITTCPHHGEKYILLRLDGSAEIIVEPGTLENDFWMLSKDSQ